MIVLAVTNLRQKRRMLIRILLALLLIALLLPLLLHNFLPAAAEAPAVSAGQESQQYPGEPLRVSTEFDRFWQRLLSESQGM